MPFVSPGVYVRELDFSEYAPFLSSTICGILGQATKGALNTPTLVTTEAELIRAFGPPRTDDFGLIAAIQFLKVGRQLLFSRVASAGDPPATASTTIEDGSAHTAVILSASSPGSWGNSVKVSIQNSVTSGAFDMVVSIQDDSGNWYDVEAYYALTWTSSADPRYFTAVINGGITGEVAASRYVVASGQTAYTPAVGVYLIGADTTGDNGGTLDATDYVGVTTDNARTGLQVFADPDSVDINLLLVPGVSHPTVCAQMLSICAARQDAMAIIDPPFGLTPADAINWHNGINNSNVKAAIEPADSGLNSQTNSFNTSFGATFAPWVQVPDAYNDREPFIPPSAFAAAAMAFTDYQAFPWFAPAGLTRGKLLNAISLEYSPSLGTRDSMYGNFSGTQNAVNPIVNFVGDGITIWGQRTLQRAPTALDRINVRRGLSQIEKMVSTAARVLTFEPNDKITWARFKNLVTPSLEYVKINRGLFAYGILCDDSTNPGFLIDNNEMNAKIWIQPTKAAEKIVVDFVLLATGASFSSINL